MNLQDLIHKKTWKEIQGYLAMSEPPGLILSGISGLGKFELGMHIAAVILNCEEKKLKMNPDFYMINSEKAITTDDIKDLIEFSWRSSLMGKKVILVNHAQTISVSSQNKLLKILEDRKENILLLLADSNTLLPTVVSRCCFIQLQPPETSTINRFFKDKGVCDSDIAFLSYMVGNAPFLYAKEEDILIEYKKQLEKIYGITARSDLLKVMSMLKEKDSNSFFEKNTAHISWNIKLIIYPFYNFYFEIINNKKKETDIYPGNLYTKDEAYRIICVGQNHLKMKNYTKNDYFSLLRYIIFPEG